MHILFINRCYHPDVEATGQLLAELCTDLAQSHEVTVIAGRPNFVHRVCGPGLFLSRERHGRVQVMRTRNVRFTKRSLFGRALGLASYLLLALWAGLRARRPDVIVVETDPPVLGVLGVFLRWWHSAPLIYYLQDLFPEVGLIMGRLRPGLLTAFLRWATQLGLRRAERVVVLGEDMRQRVLQRGIAPDRIVLVPNWTDTSLVRPAHRDNPVRRQWGLTESFVVMYSGNLGLSQSLDHILDAAARLRDEPIVFVFVGEGAAKDGLMQRARAAALARVRFYPYQPKECLSASLSAADLHLIPLRRGLAGCIVPSKLYGILASGTAYVAAVDGDSEVARVTHSAQSGLLIDPDSGEQLAEAIRWGAEHCQELEAMGRRGRKLAETCFDRSRATARFQGMLEEVAGAPVVAERSFTP